MQKLILILTSLVLTGLLKAESKDSLKLIRKLIEDARSGNVEDTLQCHTIFNLAQSSGETKAEEYYNQLKTILETRINMLPVNHSLLRTYNIDLSNVYNELGLVYRNRGDVIKALENFYAALKLDEKLYGKDQLGVDYNNIALVYHDVGDRAKALEYFKKGLEIARAENDKFGTAYALLNVGMQYQFSGKLKEALECFNQSLKISKLLNEKRAEAFAYNHIGLINAKQGFYNKAMDNYDSSINVSKKLNDNQGIASTLANIGNCYLLQKKYEPAIIHGIKALKMSKEQKNVEHIRVAALLLKEANEQLGNFKEALSMHALYIQMRDSTRNESTHKAALKKQMEFEFEKKELLLKEEQERISKLHEQRGRFYKVIALVVSVLVILGFYFLYFRFKFIKERDSKNLHIELKERLLQEIREKESIANSIIHIQEQEREKLAAELHDGVNQLLFAAKIQMQAAKSTEEQMHRDAVKLVETAIQEIRSIAGNQGSFILNDKKLSDALTDLVLHMKSNREIAITFLNKGLDEEKLNAQQKTNILRIIQELLNNAIKHAGARQCYISIKTSADKIQIAVTDSGIGLKNISNTTGNGLKNINNKVALMKGGWRLFSISGKGTKVYIQIPLTSS